MVLQCTAAHATQHQRPFPEPPPLRPSFAHHLQAREQAGLDIAPAELAPHLALDSVLAGLSSLLDQLLGVQLLPRQLAEAERMGHASSRALAVVSATRGLVGTLYIDPGGGYGTRMVRLGSPVQASSSSSGGGGGGGTDGSSTAHATRQEGSAAGPALQQQQGGVAADVDVQVMVGLPAASVGLGAELATGDTLTTSGLWELVHEAGHAVHLLLSSR